MPAVSGRWSIPSQHRWDHIWSALSSMRKLWSDWSESSHKDKYETGASSIYVERLREMGLLNLEKKRFKGNLIKVYKYMVWAAEEEKAKLLSALLTDWQWAEIKTHEIACNGLSREILEFPSLEIFKTKLDMNLTISYIWPWLNRDIGYTTSENPS